MAVNTHMSLASWNLALNAGLDVLNGGFLEIYSGTQPATPDVAIGAQVKLAKLPLNATAFGAAASGVKTANAIAAANALATGTAAWARAFKADDGTAVLDGSVGTSAADFIINTVSLTVGASVQVTSWTASAPAAQ